MLYTVSFKAKPGKEVELHGLLDDPDAGRRFAEALGANRNTLFLNDDGRMIRVMEFPEGVAPTPMHEVAAADERAKAFLAKVGALVEDGFDVEDLDSLAAFERRNNFRVAYDVQV